MRNSLYSAIKSEYLAEHDFRVKFLTGFTGSNAYVAVTNQKAVLWTDGRYFTQADEQLVPPFALLKQGQADSISVEDFVVENLDAEGGQKLVKTLEGMGLHVAPVKENLVDELWKNRPPLQSKGPIVLSLQEHGRETEDKLRELRERIGRKKCSSIILTALDDIMWLLNIRGFDIKHNPLVYSYLLVTPDEVHLFMDKADETMRAYLKQKQVVLHPYEKAYVYVSNWNDQQKAANKDKHRVFVPTSTNYLFGSLFESVSVVDNSPVQVMKGVKNSVEMEGMRNSHIRDSAELVSFLMQLEEELTAGHTMTEIEAAAKIDSMRSKVEKYVDLSFSTISAAGDHAAKPHYHSEGEAGKRLVTTDQVYLLDSGAHYRYPIGHTHKACNVAASIGHRQSLSGPDSWVREGMVLTIEPGYYLEGKWGVRIENCYEVVKATVPSGADFLGFKSLTLVPIQTTLIDKAMLTEKEVEWLNAYHDRVLSTVGEYLRKTGRTKEVEWLKKQCAHI
ncbi:hypothetical protein ANCCEY_10259 [Ancylostoma ceylanicum]|uniref:Creatinase n=1 Tax=Ancylostoma ceylanicum TaxID=53326 RepID=A0A0D6LEW2_9BILA|nr:hypothetical protein ANCCEY_10259 [Ancylostoma ceylanicum]